MFYSSVDRNKASSEYNLVRLRECLQREAHKVIEHLGHTAAAYEAAKLKDANQGVELRNESLYITPSEEVNKSLLSKYKKWIRLNRTENVETLRQFTDRDSEFFTTGASETISGILKQPFKRDKHVPPAGSSF